MIISASSSTAGGLNWWRANSRVGLWLIRSIFITKIVVGVNRSGTLGVVISPDDILHKKSKSCKFRNAITHAKNYIESEVSRCSYRSLRQALRKGKIIECAGQILQDPCHLL